jgi:hypothetical protein
MPVHVMPREILAARELLAQSSPRSDGVGL